MVTKGSVEALHARHGHGLHPIAWHEALHAAADLAGEGFRVLAVTAGEAPADPAGRTPTSGCSAWSR